MVNDWLAKSKSAQPQTSRVSHEGRDGQRISLDMWGRAERQAIEAPVAQGRTAVRRDQAGASRSINDTAAAEAAAGVSADERNRTSTGCYPHKNLNLARLPVPPHPRQGRVYAHPAGGPAEEIMVAGG